MKSSISRFASRRGELPYDYSWGGQGTVTLSASLIKGLPPPARGLYRTQCLFHKSSHRCEVVPSSQKKCHRLIEASIEWPTIIVGWGGEMSGRVGGSQPMPRTLVSGFHVRRAHPARLTASDTDPVPHTSNTWQGMTGPRSWLCRRLPHSIHWFVIVFHLFPVRIAWACHLGVKKPFFRAASQRTGFYFRSTKMTIPWRLKNQTDPSIISRSNQGSYITVPCHCFCSKFSFSSNLRY